MQTMTDTKRIKISIHALLAESDGQLQQRSAQYEDFYPRSPCGERPVHRLSTTTRSRISIHALLAESDLLRHRSPADCLDFYPRSPCGERPGRWAGRLLQVQFLSTLSLRRATERGNHNQVGWQISIHALLAESDLFGLGTPSILPQFLSTLSLRRATSNFCTKTKQDLQFLSTLSLRRATRIRPVFSRRCRYFYPRSPCGERPFDA